METNTDSLKYTNNDEQTEYASKLRREVQQMRKNRKLAEQEAKHMELGLQILDSENKSNKIHVKKCKEKAMKRLEYIETFAISQRKKTELKDQKFKELQNLKEQNSVIRANLHKSVDLKRKDFLSKTSEEGLLSNLKKEYYKELKSLRENEEMVKNQKNVNKIRNNISDFKEKKNKEILDRRMENIRQLENLLVCEFKTKELAEVMIIFSITIRKKSMKLMKKRRMFLRK